MSGTTIHTAIMSGPSWGPRYLVAKSKKALRLIIAECVAQQLRYDSVAEVAIYWHHDCRVMSDDGQVVIGTDGYPDAIGRYTLTRSGRAVASWDIES